MVEKRRGPGEQRRLRRGRVEQEGVEKGRKKVGKKEED